MSTDSAAGTDQKNDVFWGKITELFQQKCDEQKIVVPNLVGNRTWSGLECRFKRHIQSKVSLWNVHWRTITEKNPSGHNEESLKQMTKALFVDMEGHSFKFAHCVPVLNALPKFDPMVDDDLSVYSSEEEEDKKQKATTNKIKKPMGHGKERPVGAKMKKKMKKDASSVQKQEEATAGSIDKLTEAHKGIAQALASRNDVEREKIAAEREKNFIEWEKSRIKMAEMYQSMGDMTTMASILQEARAKRQERDAAAAAASAAAGGASSNVPSIVNTSDAPAASTPTASAPGPAPTPSPVTNGGANDESPSTDDGTGTPPGCIEIPEEEITNRAKI